MEELLSRYSPAQQQVIKEYWDTIRFTRKTGRISDGIKKRELEYWSRFEPEIVIQALQIHIRKYPNFREEYTRGIMRNLQGGSAGRASTERHSSNYQDEKLKRDSRAEEAFRKRLGY